MTARARLVALCQRIACQFASLGPGLSALAIVAAWVIYELVRAWTARGG